MCRVQVQEIYGIELSNGTLNAVTDKLLPELERLRERDLNAVYPIVWLDAMHYKIKENGRFVSKAVYTILALNLEGKKELLGLYLSDAEGAHYWLSADRSAKSRRQRHSECLCGWVEELPGSHRNHLPAHRNSELCIIHQIRNSMKYVASKNQKGLLYGGFENRVQSRREKRGRNRAQ